MLTKKKLCSCITILFALFLNCAVTALAADYYISNSGSDENTGTSPTAAWRTLEKASVAELLPGDSILLECGGIWNGQLRPKGSGNVDAPITIASYGDGAKPIINGGGIDGQYKGGAIVLFNQSYFTIRDVEVTNKAEKMAWRNGILVYFENTIGHGITISNVDVHDVMGGAGVISGTSHMKDNHFEGGIAVRACATGKVPTYVDDIIIENCTVHDVRRTGILLDSNFAGPMALVEGGYSHNVTVRGNTVYNIWGDGIMIGGADGGVIEHNLAYDTNLMSMNGYPEANISIWGIHSNNLVFRYNEAYLCHTTKDGYGYDIDGDCKNIIFEYNYSHDNDGGFILLVNYRNENAIVRYNISENDHQWFIASAHMPSAPSSFWNITAQIYNNTFYSKERGVKNLLMLGRPKHMDVYNNIFYAEADEISEIPCTYPLNVSRSNNLYYFGNSDKTISIDEENAVIGVDPKFVGVGSGKNNDMSLPGYRLFEDSPAIGAGILVSGNGGRDYYGNNVSNTAAPNIGAYGGTGVSYNDLAATELAKKLDVHLKIGSPVMTVAGEDKSVDSRDTMATPFIHEGVTMVPIRTLSEALGAELSWNYENKSVTISSAGPDIVFSADSVNYTVGGMEKSWQKRPVIINNIVYVPLRQIAKEFGKSVIWDNGNLHITTNERLYQ